MSTGVVVVSIWKVRYRLLNGWAVSYHVSREEMFDILLSEIKLPWPELSEEEQKVVNKNYEKLYKSLEDE